MTRAVEGFTGLEHALEPVTELGGVRFVNDSKATNIESALRAIQSFDTGLVVILGGKFKGGDFADLRDALKARTASVVAIGEAAPLDPSRRWSRRCRCTTRPTWWPPCGRRSPWPRRATPCCWRRRAPASTCS